MQGVSIDPSLPYLWILPDVKDQLPGVLPRVVDILGARSKSLGIAEGLVSLPLCLDSLSSALPAIPPQFIWGT